MVSNSDTLQTGRYWDYLSLRIFLLASLIFHTVCIFTGVMGLFRGNGVNMMRIVPVLSLELAMFERLKVLWHHCKIRQTLFNNMAPMHVIASDLPLSSSVSFGANYATHVTFSPQTFSSQDNSSPYLGNIPRLRMSELALLGGLSGMVVNAAFYPLDFVRGLLSIQVGPQRPRFSVHGTLGSLLQTVWCTEGIRGFYRGCGVSMA